MYVDIDHLKEGMIISEVVFLGNAPFISSGMVLTNQLIDSLKEHKDLLEHNVLKVSIKMLPIHEQHKLEKELEWNQNNINYSIDFKKRKEIQETLKNLTKYTIDKSKDEKDKEKEKKYNDHIELVQEWATTIVNTLYYKQFKIVNEKSKEKTWFPNLDYNLEEYEGQNDIYEHSLRVAQFAVVVAAAYNQKKLPEEPINLKNIAIAALLHDYGICYQDPIAMKSLSNYQLSYYLKNNFKIDPDILVKPYNQMNSPIYSFVSLPLDNTITNIILFSQENEAETGPLKSNIADITTQENIKIAAKIINICHLYDITLKQAITNGINGQNMNLENVSAVMDYAAKNKLIDKELLDIFYDTIPLYSVGTRILLSDGRYGRVEKRKTGKTTSAKPTIITTDGDIVDLTKSKLTIKRIVTKDEKLSNLVNNTALDQVEEMESDYVEESHIKK